MDRNAITITRRYAMLCVAAALLASWMWSCGRLTDNGTDDQPTNDNTLDPAAA